MAAFAVLPGEEPGWRFEPVEFVARIAVRWPDATTAINDLPGSSMVVHALVPFGPPRREVGVALSDTGNEVSLDPADPDTAAEFVAWYVTQIPSFDPPVYVWAGGFARQLELRADTTAAEVEAFLSG
jgi:hypothetical protein